MARTWSCVTLPTEPLPGVVAPLLQEVADRRRLHLEGEGSVGVDGEHHRDRRALLHVGRSRIEGLAELHDVKAALAERRPDRRRRIGGPGGDLQLQVAGDLLCHALLRFVPARGAALRSVVRP
jgi:hypothetical protein